MNNIRLAKKAGRSAAVRDIDKKGKDYIAAEFEILLQKHLKRCRRGSKTDEYINNYESTYKEKVLQILGIALENNDARVTPQKNKTKTSDLTIENANISQSCGTNENQQSCKINYTHTQTIIIENLLRHLANVIARDDANLFDGFYSTGSHYDIVYAKFSDLLYNPRFVAGMTQSLHFTKTQLFEYGELLHSLSQKELWSSYQYGMRVGSYIKYILRGSNCKNTLSSQDWINAVINYELHTGYLMPLYDMFINDELVLYRLSLTQLPKKVELDLPDCQFLSPIPNSPEPKGLFNYYDHCKETTAQSQEEYFVASFLRDRPST